MPRLISQQGRQQQQSVMKEHLQSWILPLRCRPYCKLCSWITEWPNQKPIHYEQSKTTTWFPELFLTPFGHQWVFSDAKSDQCLVMSTSIYSPGYFWWLLYYNKTFQLWFIQFWGRKRNRFGHIQVNPEYSRKYILRFPAGQLRFTTKQDYTVNKFGDGVFNVTGGSLNRAKSLQKQKYQLSHMSWTPANKALPGTTA